MADQYKELGVDAGKDTVRNIFKGGVRNDFPGAFINMVRSRQFPGFVKTQHSDGDGSKIILRLLMYFLTGHRFWLHGFIDDAWSMNFGDMACGGFVEGEFLVTDTVNQNAFNVPKEEILTAISERVPELLELYARYGFDGIDHSIFFLGGETADLPRQVQTAVFDVTVSGCMKEEGVIKGDVCRGDQIWGWASDGKAAWEPEPNSGIMSNGLTLGVNVLISPTYLKKFPKLLIAGESFKGTHGVGDKSGVDDMTIAQALLSPTRQWAIPIKLLIDKLKADKALSLLRGLVMNTGGGATKALHLGYGGVVYEKWMPNPSPIFHLIQKESGEEWKNMFRSFNCGVGVDIIGDRSLAPYLKAVERETAIKLYELGECLGTRRATNELVLQTTWGQFRY